MDGNECQQKGSGCLEKPLSAKKHIANQMSPMGLLCSLADFSIMMNPSLFEIWLLEAPYLG